MATEFRCVDAKDRIHAAEAKVVIGRRYCDLYFRIDGRGEKYRVDVEKPLMPLWEAIDGGTGFATLTEAKTHVRKWLRAAFAQQDLTPNMNEVQVSA